jgi:hypothetical protein
LLFNNPSPVQASYESEQLIVEANPWQNAAHPLDVNHNGFITGLDALIIINRLNLQGPAVLPVPGQPIPGDVPPVPAYPQPFYDVNGDGRVTALDGLIVINHLNAVGPGPVVSAAGDDEDGSIVAAAAPAAMTSASGTPLASSFDVTPVAISVAGSGSTATAPAFARLAESRAAAAAIAVETAVADLFDEVEPESVRVRQSQPAVESLASAIADDAPWRAEGNYTDDPTTLAVADLRATELEAMLEGLGLGPANKKKKGLLQV